MSGSSVWVVFTHDALEIMTSHLKPKLPFENVKGIMVVHPITEGCIVFARGDRLTYIPNQSKGKMISHQMLISIRAQDYRV